MLIFIVIVFITLKFNRLKKKLLRHYTGGTIKTQVLFAYAAANNGQRTTANKVAVEIVFPAFCAR
jgi:hypothetical protein